MNVEIKIYDCVIDPVCSGVDWRYQNTEMGGGEIRTLTERVDARAVVQATSEDAFVNISLDGD